MAKLGWRTGMYDNGEYQVQAIGHLGDLESIPSDVVPVVVEN